MLNGPPDQERIDETAGVNGITSTFDFSGSYSIDGITGTATVTELVPEPTTLGLLSIAGMGLLRRRRTV